MQNHLQISSLIKSNTDDELDTYRDPEKVSQSIQRKKKPSDELCLYESSVCISQFPAIVAHLDANGMETSFAVFTLTTKIDKENQNDDLINLQFAIEDGIVGLEWPLIRPRNIADKQRVLNYIAKRGYIVTERVQKFAETELFDMPYIRVEEGDIIDLGIRIATELYQIEPNDEISLLVDGFEKPELRMADVLNFVRRSAKQPEFIADVERISAVLRMIHGKSTYEGGDAFAEFSTFLGIVRFVDVFDDALNHMFWSTIAADMRTKRHEAEFLGERGINLLSACGYHRLYSTENNYDNWFSVNTDNDLTEAAEFCVGILHVLFDHQPGHPLEINFIMPGSDLDRINNWGELPEYLQEDCCTFKVRYHEVMARYHSLMAIDSSTLSGPQNLELVDTCTEMENLMGEFPAWLAKLENLGIPYARYFSYTRDNQTELFESLNVLNLRFRYKVHMLH